MESASGLALGTKSPGELRQFNDTASSSLYESPSAYNPIIN